MSTVLIVFLFLLNALIMPLVVELVKERASGLALRMIRLAVLLLPYAYRDRYRAEWTAELDEMDRQNISQLISSLRILLGAPSVGRVLRVRDRRQLLMKDSHKQLTEGDKVVRRILITILTGGLAYFITNFSNQPQIWVLTVSVFISGVALVVMFLNDFDNRLVNIEEKQATHSTEVQSVIENGFTRTAEVVKLVQAENTLSLQADVITQLARRFTQVRPENSAPTASQQHNQADVVFLQNMIHHYSQAITTSQIARNQANSPHVKDLAARIEAEQRLQIQQMSTLLTAWDTPAPATLGTMGNGQVPGMVSGAGFDQMIIQIMIVHHQGAVGMSQTELAQGSNPDTRTLAQQIISVKQAEISQMQNLLQVI